jgi:4,5-DOPA dioxygenase extradiol
MLPGFFICHGAPSLALEQNDYTRFLRELKDEIEKPKAIAIFTAHWENDILSISSRDDAYETIYDFGGFDPELYSIKYPAKGSTEAASLIESLFHKQGIATRRDSERGLDHGSWVVLRLLYPEADIPVVHISVNPKLPMKEQYKIGQSLTELKNNGVLVIGSGGTVHNLRALKWGQKQPEHWAVEFDDWLIDKVEKWDLDSLFDYERLAPHARLAVPREEHFVPLYLVMGSCDDRRKPKLLHRSYDFGTLSHICFQF